MKKGELLVFLCFKYIKDQRLLYSEDVPEIFIGNRLGIKNGPTFMFIRNILRKGFYRIWLIYKWNLFYFAIRN